MSDHPRTPSSTSGDQAPDPVLEHLSRVRDHPLVHSFPHGVMLVFDEDLRYLAIGGEGLPRTGLSREGLEGRTIFEGFPPETAAAIEGYYRAALAGESTITDIPFGDRIYSQRLAPVRDGGGLVVAGVGFTEDVTEVRAAELALRESLERSRLSFEHAPIGQAIVELDGRYRQVNPAHARLTGYTESQLQGMTYQDITHPDDLEVSRQHAERLMAGEIDAYEMDKRYITASGEEVWVHLSGAVVRDEGGSPLYFIAQILEITERKRRQEALQDLIGMLAHDLRTPAAIVTGYADLMESEWSTSTDAERLDCLRRIVAGGHQLADLLDNTLTVSTLDAKGLRAAPTVVDVAQTIHDVLETLADVVPTVDLTRVAPATVWVDPGHFTQVVYNLVTNAIKYGGSTLSFEVEERLDRVLLTVSDDGSGVPPAFVPHLFGRFSRSDESRSAGQGGTGLGLYIVRSLLELNHAHIAYSDRPGGGAAFTLELPTPPGSADPATRG